MPKRQLSGVVVSDKGDKTVTVKVERKYLHPMYKKTLRTTKKYAAHDENNSFKIGDKITIEESKPISKTKKWVVLGTGSGRAEAKVKAEAPKANAKKATKTTKKPAAKKKAS